MSDSLASDVAVVTGGASGIGRGVATTLARSGADVIVADVRKHPRVDGEPTHEYIERETDSRAMHVDCDVRDRDDVQGAVGRATEFGGISVMVNNAGIHGEDDFLEVTETEYDRLMEVNMKGVFFGSQVAAKRMIESDGGCIINMSSITGLRGNRRNPVYGASKGGVRLLTYALADRLADDGIRVNAIHPGSVATEMGKSSDPDDQSVSPPSAPLGRQGTPDDIGEAAAFLASDRSAFMTGESLVVDGGRHNTY